MSRPISEAEFKTLAKSASQENSLQGRRGPLGMEFRVVLNGRTVATAEPDVEGVLIYTLHLEG